MAEWPAPARETRGVDPSGVVATADVVGHNPVERIAGAGRVKGTVSRGTYDADRIRPYVVASRSWREATERLRAAGIPYPVSLEVYPSGDVIRRYGSLRCWFCRAASVQSVTGIPGRSGRVRVCGRHASRGRRA